MAAFDRAGRRLHGEYRDDRPAVAALSVTAAAFINAKRPSHHLYDIEDIKPLAY
jgi:hypothetical protein